MHDGWRRPDRSSLEGSAPTAVSGVLTSVGPRSRAPTVLHNLRNTLQISWVPDAFQALSKIPTYLQLAWSQLEPSLQTEQFVRLADRVARDATTVVQSLYQPSYGPDTLQQLGISHGTQVAARSALSVLIVGQSQTILAIKALRLAIEGAPPGGRVPTFWPRPKRTWTLQPIPSVKEHAAGERIRAIFVAAEHLLRLPVPPAGLRALGVWPRYLERAWQDLRVVLQTTEFAAAQTELAEEAVVLSDLFPIPVGATPTWLEGHGLSPVELRRARDLLLTYDTGLAADLLITACLRYPLIGLRATPRW